MRLAFTALIPLTLLTHGYHPFAEDGGLYVAGVEYKLDPTLFPYDTALVTAHLRYSIFAPLLAAIVHSAHLPLEWTLFLADLLSLALTFFAAHQILRRCIASAYAQLGGLALLAAWWTLPVAGTSLLLMDPYVTARSFSTPLSLLAIALALDDWRLHRRSAILCLGSVGPAALFHPLMAAYAAAFVCTLQLQRLARKRTRACVAFALAVVCFAAVLQSFAPVETAPAITAAFSRYYWFLSQWQWYELLGLAGPLIIFALLLRHARTHLTPSARTLLRTCTFVGILGLLVALLFAHRDSHVHLVARLQPLRVFLAIYAIMTLLLGAVLTQRLLDRIARTVSNKARYALMAVPFMAFVALALTFCFVQRQTYTTSPQVELPGHDAANRNPWVQAFLWARANAPHNAVFALDAKYVNQDGENAQVFRAWSLRSALPDFSKDGGEAAITPSLAPQWLAAADAQQGLSNEADAQRDPRILALGATWMIVHADTTTHHVCPYRNATVKVCSVAP